MTARHLAAALLVLGGVFIGCSDLPLRRPIPGAPAPLPAHAPTADAPVPGPGPAPSPISGLVAQATAAEAEGDPERAAALLERAIRVQPTDPLPWSRLAEVRLHQSQWQLAEQLAVKSNRLAGTAAALQARNWRLIAYSRRATGDAAGAAAAAAEAERWAGSGR